MSTTTTTTKVRNLETQLDGHTLTLKVDLSPAPTLGASGKSFVYAATGPRFKVHTPKGELTVMLSVFSPNPNAPPREKKARRARRTTNTTTTETT